MKTPKKLNVENKKVLVRCGFDVSLSSKGVILDDYRIKENLPTINYLLNNKAKVVLMSHLGRPEGKFEKKYSLRPIAMFLSKILGKKVEFLNDCKGEAVEKRISEMKPGEIVLLENLRFYKEEEENNDSFARDLARLGDFYVNDAFSVCHRAHASIVGITKFLPSVAGFSLENEVKTLKKLSKNPEKPLVAIIGGAKVETKAKLINNISEIADVVLIGGLIAREIKEKDIYLNYPAKIFPPAAGEVEGKDIGIKTIKLFREKISKAKTVFFNGVVGFTEKEKFSKGTEEILKAIIKSNAFSVIGGGDTVEFVNKLGIASKFNHVSTGGGAMIAFLAGEKLPGLEVLR
ncbi:MAG: phosphoglycerate kinase [Candidatus Pacebacteria bacterium]|nr:phosphoglycerate kinase [Candidatus Paceibacterota bacterium]